MKPDSKYMTLEDLRKKQQSDPRYMSAADLNARLEDKKRKEEERVRKEQERVRKEQEKLEIQEKQKPVARYEDPKDPISNYQKSLNAIDEINKSLGISTPKKTMPFKRDEKIHSDLDTTPEERKLEFKPEEKSTKTYSEPEEYTEPKPFSKATAVAAKIGAEYMVGFEKGINTLVDFGFGIMANAARTFGKDDKAELYDMARAYVYESKYKQASRELDDFLSPKAREGHLLQKASQFTGELAGLVTFSFLGDKATKGLFKVFSGGSTGAAISTLTENAATGTAQQVANKTGKIVTRVGGAAARYLYTRGSSMSELLEKGYTYDEAAKVANIYSGISAGLDLTTNVVYGAFSTTLLKDFTDKTVVNGTEIIIQELTKKEMITSELLRTLKVGNVEALKGVARSATKNELERMILDPTKLGYFKNENGEISLTRAGQDYLVNFVISSIVQTPGRIKNIEAFDKYQSQLMTDTAKQVDLSKASRIEISKSVKKGDSVKASPIVRTPENEQFLNSILDAAKKDGIDLTEGMNIGDGVDIVYDPDLRYEIVRTDGTKIEVHGGFKYVFEKDYHVNIQQEKHDVPKISVKKKSTDVGADYIKITNDIVSSDNPVDVKVNLLEHQISGINNVLVSNIKITPKLMKDVYTNKQILIKAKEELLSKASDTELNIIYAGSKAAEYSAKTAPDSDNKAQIIDEIQKEKEDVATLLDKDRDIKLITNKATVEKEFTENTTGAIDILNKLNENRPENDKIKFVQDYTEDQQLAVDVGSAFGKQVFFIENSNFSGFTVDTNPNVLFIDSKPVNALIKDQNSAFTYVVGHELFHSLKEVDPVTYNSFMRYIYTEVNAEQVLNFIDKYDPTATLNTINALKINGKLNMDELIKNPHEYLPQTAKLLEIVEEMAANEFGGILTTPDFWIGMNNRDSKVAERLSDIAGRMIDKINEPVYDSPLTQVQVDRIKNKFLDIISGIEEKETEKVAKPKLPVKKEVEPRKLEAKKTVSEPIKVKEEPVRKLPIKKVESKKVTPKKEVVSEPVTKTVSKIAEKATGKKPSPTVKSNTIKRLSEQRSATTKRMELTKYYEGKDEIIVTDSYSIYSLKKGTEMPIEKGDSKFYDTTLKNIRERVTKNKEEETKVLDIQQIKDNKKNKSNIDHYSGTKSGVTFIDSITIDTDKIIDAIRILGTDLKYSTQDDGIPTLFLKNPDGETALIVGIKRVDGDTKSKKDTKLPVKDTRREEYEKVLKKEEALQKTREDEEWKREFEKTKKEHVPLKEKEDRDYRMTHQPSKDGAPGYDLTNQGGEITMPDDVYDHPENYTGTLGTLGVSRLQENLLRMRNNPNAKVTIYRATTGDTINEGDWVTLNRSYAVEHNKSNLGGKGTILQKTVNAKDIRWDMDDLSEWGYFPVKKDTKLPVKPPIKKTTKEDIDHLFKEKQSDIPQKTTKEDLDLKLDMIKDNFKVFLDFKDRDILNTVIKDFNQYKKEGGTGSVPGLDGYMANKDKTIADWKDRLRASGFNIKELPKSKDEYPRTGEFKSRGIYKTILEKSPNEELADALVKRLDQQGVGKLNIEYERGSHEQYKKNVYDMLIADKSGTLDRFWNDPDDAPETIVLSKVLADYYISIGDRQSAVRAIQQVDGMGTLSGQIGEIHKIFTKDPTMFTLKIQKEIGKFYEELRDSKDPIVKAWLNEHKGGIQFNDAEMEVLYQLAKKQFELQEGTRERGIIESQIAKIIDEKKIKPLASKLKEFHRIALLSAPKTGTRNMFGNVPGYLLNTLSRNFIEVPLDKWMAKKDEMRTVGPLKPSVAHFKKGNKDAYTDFKLGINTNPTNVFERPSGKVFSEKHNTNSDIVNHMSDILGKTLNTSSRYVSMVMDGGDRGFFEFYYDSDINFFTKVYADEDGNLPGEYKQIAKENAEDYTWKNTGGWMTQMLGGLRQGGNSILRLTNKGLRVGKRLPGETQEFGLGNILSVFIMTPGNVTAAMWHFSPFGALNAGKYFKDYTDAKKEGNYEDTFRNKRKFIKAVGKTAAGSAAWLASYLVLMAAEKNGKIEITGDYSDDVKVRELQKASGYKPFSIYIPSKNKYYGYAWIQPWGAPLGAMAEINRRKKTGESMDPGSLLKGMMGGMTEAMLDQSYLATLKYLIGGVTGKRNENPIDDFFDLGVDVSGMAIEQFYPNILKTIAGAIDNNLIDTYNPDRPVKGIGEQLIGYTPVKKKLPVKKDVFGGDRKFGYTSGSPFWDAINTIFNPMPISTAKYTSEYNELMDIYDKTGTSKFLPETITNKIQHKEQTIKMNPKQKQELQQRIGTMYYLGLKTLMDNKVYDTATASEKVRMLQSLKLYSKDVSIADMGLFDDYVLDTDAKRIQGYMDKGLSLESALVFYGKMDGNDKSYLKAKEVMKMNVSDAEKDIMLSLVSPTAKTSPTSSDLGHLDTDADFDAYYSLSSAKREQHSNYGKHFNIKVDTFASAIKDISKIESKKDTAGKTIPNSKRDQVRAYIEKLPNLSAAQKLYLYNTVGYTINTEANSKIMYKYIESLSLSVKDKVEIWNALGFK